MAGFEIDFARSELRFDGETVHLDPRLKKLLHFLASNPDQPLKKTDIQQALDIFTLKNLTADISKLKLLFPSSLQDTCFPRSKNGCYTFNLPPEVQVIWAPDAPSRPLLSPPKTPHVQRYCELLENAKNGTPADGEVLITHILTHMEELKYDLPAEGLVPASRCTAEKGQPSLFLAQLYLEQAQRLLNDCTPRHKDLTHYVERQLRAAIEHAEHAADIALDRREAERVWLHHEGNHERPVADLWYVRGQLLIAECYMRLEKLDPNASQEDRDWCYLSPARTAYARAKAQLNAAKGQTDTAPYTKLAAKTADLGHQLGSSAMVITENKTHAPPETKLVFNTVYDSAAAQNTAQTDMMYLQTLQMAATPGVKILFQLPQLLDNAYVVGTLLHDPGFCTLCSHEIIVLSSFGAIIDPKKYIIRNLNNPNFIFSASPWLQLPQIRQILADGLVNGKSFAALAPLLPLPSREELSRLYSGYCRASSLFKPSAICRYHQQKAPAGVLQKGPQLELSDMVEYRLGQLNEDQRIYPLPGRSQLLSQLEQVQYAARDARAQTRSDYKSLMQQWQTGGTFAPDLLEQADRLVDLCYGCSSGYRSTQHILSVSADFDDPLCVHSHIQPQVSDPIGVVSYAMNFTRRTADPHSAPQVLGLDNVLELALIVRQLTAEEHKGDALSQHLEKATGIGYAPDPDGDLRPSSFCIKRGSQTQQISLGREDGFCLESNRTGGYPHEN